VIGANMEKIDISLLLVISQKVMSHVYALVQLCATGLFTKRIAL
jgi:hypothetical protein